MLFSVYVSYVLLTNAGFIRIISCADPAICQILKVNVDPGPKSLPTPALPLT